MEPWRPTIGTITETGLGRTILLVEYPENPNNGEQIIVTVLDDARISKLMASGSTPATFGDLRTGMRVAVILVGALAESYPAQGTAGEIIILRTETDGPPDLQDTVTMDFEFNLSTGYPPNRSLSSNDDFLVSYEITGGNDGDSYFCGNAPEAPEPCSGSAGYNLLIEVPRGAELRYEIKRLPEGDPTQAEIFESGREIMDIDLTTRSHYRYGAPNPGGYD